MTGLCLPRIRRSHSAPWLLADEIVPDLIYFNQWIYFISNPYVERIKIDPDGMDDAAVLRAKGGASE